LKAGGLYGYCGVGCIVPAKDFPDYVIGGVPSRDGSAYTRDTQAASPDESRAIDVFLPYARPATRYIPMVLR
jgi:hypothetical protein